MSLIEEKSNNSNISRYYHVDHVSNICEAVAWICSVIKSKTVVPTYISLSDLVNRSDEGSGNTQLDPTATYNDIMQEIDNKNIDIISVNGRFQEKPIVVGVDLRNSQCFLTARKSNKFDFKAVENKLNLCDDAVIPIAIVPVSTGKRGPTQSAASERGSNSKRAPIFRRAAGCYAIGRRKSSLAKVHVYGNGTGSITINGRDIDDYFDLETLKLIVRQPLTTTDTIGKVDIVCTVDGGGVTGQAGAIRQGIARALLEINPEFHTQLRAAGLLTREPRMRERKKYGLKAARRTLQLKKR